MPQLHSQYQARYYGEPAQHMPQPSRVPLLSVEHKRSPVVSDHRAPLTTHRNICCLLNLMWSAVIAIKGYSEIWEMLCVTDPCGDLYRNKIVNRPCCCIGC